MYNERLQNLHFTKYCYGGNVQKDEMGGTCNNQGTEEKCLCLSKTNTLSIQEYVGGNIVIDLMEMVWAYGDVDWINMAQKLRLRPQGHRDRPFIILQKLNSNTAPV